MISLFIALGLLINTYSLSTQELQQSADDLTQQKLTAQVDSLSQILAELDAFDNQQASLLITKAEASITTANGMVRVSQIVISFITVVVGLFSFVGFMEIRRIYSLKSQLNEELEGMQRSRAQILDEIQSLKSASLQEGKDLLQILFCISEGDRDRGAGKHEEAINWYLQALKVRDDDPEVYFKLGYMYSKIGDYGAAIAYLDKGQKVSPDNLAIITAKARAYRKSDQYDKAKELYHHALGIDDNHVWTLSGLAQVHIHKKNFAEAEVVLKKVLMKEDSYHPHLNLGVVYLGLPGMQEKATQHFNTALNKINERLNRSPDNAGLLSRKIIILTGLLHIDEALALLNRLTELGVVHEMLRSIYERMRFFLSINHHDRIQEIMAIIQKQMN